MATLSASLATAAAPIRSGRRGRKLQVQKMSAFGGLKAVNNIMAMGCSKNVDQEFAKLQIRCRIAGATSKSKCGGALALECSTNIQDFWTTFWGVIGGTLLGVALGFVLIRLEQLYEESLEGEDG